MADRSTPTICVVLSEHLSNHYIGPLGQGAVAAAAALGVRLILYSPLNIYLDRRDFTLADLALLPQHVDSYLVPSNIAVQNAAAICEGGASESLCTPLERMPTSHNTRSSAGSRNPLSVFTSHPRG